jgi:hypothetical protein
MSLDGDLAATAAYMTRLRQAIARQLVRVAKLSHVGCSTTDAEGTLEAFCSTLSVMEEHERHLLKVKQRAALA